MTTVLTSTGNMHLQSLWAVSAWPGRLNSLRLSVTKKHLGIWLKTSCNSSTLFWALYKSCITHKCICWSPIQHDNATPTTAGARASNACASKSGDSMLSLWHTLRCHLDTRITICNRVWPEYCCNIWSCHSLSCLGPAQAIDIVQCHQLSILFTLSSSARLISLQNFYISLSHPLGHQLKFIHGVVLLTLLLPSIKHMAIMHDGNNLITTKAFTVVERKLDLLYFYSLCIGMSTSWYLQVQPNSILG